MNPLVIQAAIAAGLELAKLTVEFMEAVKNNPNMTQAEFQAKWNAVKGRVTAAEVAWHASMQQS